MATSVRAGNTVVLQVGGATDTVLGSFQPPGYRVDTVIGPPSGGTLVRAGGAVTLGEMSADFSPNSPGALRDWAQRFAGGDLSPLSGAAQVLDHNGALRRSLAFDTGEITALRLPVLSAADGRQALTLGLSWRMQSLKDGVGDGRKISSTLPRSKAMLASNFKVQGLPFDGEGVVTVALPVLRRIDAGSGPRGRGPVPGVVLPGELVLGLGGRSADPARAWVQKVVADGQLAASEQFDLVVHLLDASLKATLATVQLQGCRLLAFDEPALSGAADASARLQLRLGVAAVALGFDKG